MTSQRSSLNNCPGARSLENRSASQSSMASGNGVRAPPAFAVPQTRSQRAVKVARADLGERVGEAREIAPKGVVGAHQGRRNGGRAVVVQEVRCLGHESNRPSGNEARFLAGTWTTNDHERNRRTLEKVGSPSQSSGYATIFRVTPRAARVPKLWERREISARSPGGGHEP